MHSSLTAEDLRSIPKCHDPRAYKKCSECLSVLHSKKFALKDNSLELRIFSVRGDQYENPRGNMCLECYYEALAERHRKERESWIKSPERLKRIMQMQQKHSAAYLVRRILAEPPWADRNKISKIYKEAKNLTKTTGTKYAVDHIIPLKHSMVCGLHVHENLQILTKSENSRKRNKFPLE